MMALTVSQPYASLIAGGEKWIENRRWATDYRGPLAIHAGKGRQYLDSEDLQGYPTGCFLAVARLAACVNRGVLLRSPPHEIIYNTSLSILKVLAHKHCEGPWLWILSDVRRLDPPIPGRGFPGLFRCDVETPR